MRGICSILIVWFVISSGYSQAPRYEFILNQGQWPDQVLYRTHIPHGYMWVTQNEIVYQHFPEILHGYSSNSKNNKIAAGEYQTVRVKFGANIPQILPQKTIEKYNFFIGNDPAEWKSLVPSHDNIVLKNTYDGIDLKINQSDQSLKYEYVVHPGADVQQIKMEYSGANSIRLVDGKLLISTEFGNIQEYEPYTFQQNGNARQKVKSSYKLEGNVVRFEIDSYDKTKDLIIDPELVFSTYSGSTSDNWSHSATYDSQGNLYAGGSVFGSRYPVTAGVFQRTIGGANEATAFSDVIRTDIVITKYSPEGKKLYATFLGGNETEVPHSLIVNSKDQLVVYGTTTSTNFPISSNAFKKTFTTGNGSNSIPKTTNIGTSLKTDIFISVIEFDGSKLLSSTYLGGNDNDGLHDIREMTIRSYGDEFRGEVYVDSKDNILIASTSNSANFPLKNSFHEKKSKADAIVVKMNFNLSEILFSSFLGGDGYDCGFAIRTDKNDNIYVLGTTKSSDFSPVPNINKTTFSGDSDAYLTKISADYKNTSTTYLGTTEADIGSLLDIDQQGNVYVFGLTKGSYPVSQGVYSNPNSGQFIHVLTPNLDNTLYTTVVGSGGGKVSIVPTAFMVNSCGNVYLSGWGGINNVKGSYNVESTTTGLPITQNAFKKTTNGSNYYFAILEKNLKSLLYGTYFGSETPTVGNLRGDHLDGGTCRFDKNGVIYHTACACKSEGGGQILFPLKNAVNSSFASTNCNLAAFKFDLDGLQAKFNILEGSNTNPPEICSPVKIDFDNLSIGGETYEWFINGRRVSTAKSTGITLDTTGIYDIKLKIFNKLNCRAVDSVSRKIKATKINATSSKDTTVCPGKLVKLFATGGESYEWSPGTLFKNPTQANQEISPTSSQTVFVKVTQGKCSITKSVQIKAEAFKADFKTSNSRSFCKGDTITLNVQSSALRVVWKGDKILDSTANSIQVVPEKSKSYSVTGFYEDGCNPTNTISLTQDNSVALDFESDYSQECNKKTEFVLINKSTGGESYNWTIEGQPNFTGQNPKPFEILTSKPIEVNLSSKSKLGCSYTISKKFEPQAFDGFIPNVITPNGDGKNETFVVGYYKPELTIFDPSGKKVLETKEYDNSWGKKAITGQYYFTLITNSRKTCKGYIAVLR
ncbi:MAG: gliding motility-associated C-terminal domain-containing protein [Leadbetterella sp.]